MSAVDDSLVYEASMSLVKFSEYCFTFPYVNMDFHERWYNTIENPVNKSGLIIAPRNSAKSTCWAKVAPLYLLGRNPDLRIVLISRTSTLAQTNLRFLRLQIESNDRVKEVFPYREINGRVYGLKPSSPWGSETISVENNRRDGVPSVYAVGLEGSISGIRADLIIVDDLIDQNNVMTDSQREKVGQFWDTVVTPTLNPDGRIFCVGCLVAGTRVTMGDGTWKSIEDCLVGDRVISYDSVETVEAMIPQGVADVYELKTKNTTIEATTNHPFLCERDGKHVFVKLENLKVGDHIISYNKREGGIAPFGLDKETMWVLGFMFGDGWVTHNDNKISEKVRYSGRRWVTCFAKSVQNWKNERVLNYFKERFNADLFETDFGYYRTGVAKVGRFLEGIGFRGKALTKRIPEYVFSLSEPLREAFLEGFTAADGHIDKANCVNIELSNRELVLDFKQLADGLGYKTSNIYERIRLTQAPHSPEPIEAYSAHIRHGYTKNNDKWIKEYVKSIKYIGKKEVYDLTISNTHNFIANGLVTHNTRYHAKDFYSRLLEDDMYRDNTSMFPAIKLAENGEYLLDSEGNMQSYWPQRWPVSKLLDMKERMGSLAFNSQYQCDPSGYAGQLFDPEHIQFYDPIKGILPIWGDLDFIMSVDPNITDDPSSDNTAIITGAVDRKRGDLYVLDIFAKPLDFVGQVKELMHYGNRAQVSVGSHRFESEVKISKIGVEAVAYQRSLQQTGYLSGLPVVEIKQGNRKKDVRILGIQPHIENGRVKFPDPDKVNIPWWDAFYEEYCTFPKGRRDDRLDALEILVSMVSESFGTSGIPWGPSGDGLQVRRGGRFMEEVLGRMIR